MSTNDKITISPATAAELLRATAAYTVMDNDAVARITVALPKHDGDDFELTININDSNYTHGVLGPVRKALREMMREHPIPASITIKINYGCFAKAAVSGC
jgi:hypothetical protein